MSKWTSIVLVVLLVLALGAAMYFATPEDAGGVLPAKLLDFGGSDVLTITVKNARGEVRLERDSSDRERWRVRTDTTAVRADSIKVEDLLHELSRLQPKNVFGASEVGPQDLANWGLESPLARVTLGFEGRTTEAVFGRRTSEGRNAWARRGGEPEVYLVPADPLERLEQVTVAEVRERSPLGWSSHEVRSLSLRRNDGTVLEATRTPAGTWEATVPFTGAVEPVAMEALVSKVLRLEAKEFVFDGAVDPEKHGLADPLAVLALRREGRESPVTIRLSRPGDDGGAFFAEDGEPSVFSCGPDLPKAVAALDPAALRDRNLLRLGWTKLDSIEFVHPEKGWKLLRVLERWDVEKPERVKAEDAEVERLLERLRGLEATAFLDGEDPEALGLGSAESAPTRLELVGVDDGGRRTLLLGKRREDGGAEVRLLAAGPSKAAHPPAVVPGEFLDLLESGWLHWRTREVLEIPLAEVRGISRKTEGGTQSFLREGNAWKAAPGGPEPDSGALTAAITQLLHLECTAFEAKTKEDLGRWGLGDPPAGPEITVTLRAEGEAQPRTRTLILGGAPEGGGSHYARLADSDLVFRIPDHRLQGAEMVKVHEILTADWAKTE